MSPDCTFYVTNLIEQAIAHMLYICPRLNFGCGCCSAPRRLSITQSRTLLELSLSVVYLLFK